MVRGQRQSRVWKGGGRKHPVLSEKSQGRSARSSVTEARNPRSEVPEAGTRPQAAGWARIFQRSRTLEMGCAFYPSWGTREGHVFSEASLRDLHRTCLTPASTKFTKGIHRDGSVPPISNARKQTQRTHSTQMTGSDREPHPAPGTPHPSICALGEYDGRLTF